MICPRFAKKKNCEENSSKRITWIKRIVAQIIFVRILTHKVRKSRVRCEYAGRAQGSISWILNSGALLQYQARNDGTIIPRRKKKISWCTQSLSWCNSYLALAFPCIRLSIKETWESLKFPFRPFLFSGQLLYTIVLKALYLSFISEYNRSSYSYIALALRRPSTHRFRPGPASPALPPLALPLGTALDLAILRIVPPCPFLAQPYDEGCIRRESHSSQNQSFAGK